MAYTKNTWKTGDIVSSQKLNHMEDGIASSGVMVINNNDGTLDKTWQEIYDAMSAGVPCYISSSESNGTTRYCAMECAAIAEYDGSDYIVSSIYILLGQVEVNKFGTSSANGYPVHVLDKDK